MLEKAEKAPEDPGEKLDTRGGSSHLGSSRRCSTTAPPPASPPLPTLPSAPRPRPCRSPPAGHAPRGVPPPPALEARTRKVVRRLPSARKQAGQAPGPGNAVLRLVRQGRGRCVVILAGPLGGLQP